MYFFGGIQPVLNAYPLANTDSSSNEMAFLKVFDVCTAEQAEKYDLAIENMCFLCPPGFYGRINGKNETERTVCEKCPKGTFSEFWGSASCAPFRYFCDRKHALTAATSAVFCPPCGEGYYARESECFKCPVGAFCPIGASAPVFLIFFFAFLIYLYFIFIFF